ncbi:MAG: hypothetical protein HRU01_03050 [Myxococcales bacterium]|nr:hypothetical protein [Myxococcales bacterium]
MPGRPERAAAAEGADRGDRLFRASAAVALLLHAWLLASADGLRGGVDLLAHLRLMEAMGADPALRSVYAPAFHGFGAVFAPVVGLEIVPRMFAFVGACAWIGGFRFFQRAVGLPAESSALFALAPYAFGFSACLPKVEAAGYGFLCVGLGLLHTRRYVGAAVVVALTFWIHTASALLLGLAGGVLALASGDRRALVSLAVGALLASPLQLAHLAAGCSLPEALRLTRVDYLIKGRTSNLANWVPLLVLANPLALIAAGLGARALWRSQRPIAVLSAVLAVIYFNELWLAPFGQRISLDLLRGLSVLALPVAIAGGIGLAARRSLAPWWIALCVLWAIGASISAVPRVCFTRPISLSEIRGLEVSRCSFSWRGPNVQRPERMRR